MLIIDLLYNLSVLIALTVLSGFINIRFKRTQLQSKILQGLLFGITAVVGMFNPFIPSERIIFDGRSIILSLCTLFFGPVSGIIASAITIAYRIYIGGSGTLMGTLVVCTSFLIGLIFYFRRARALKKELTSVQLYIFGLFVHIAMLILVLSLPSDRVDDTYKIIFFTFLGVFPLVTIITGKIFVDHEEKQNFVYKIKESEKLFRTTLYSIGDGVITTDQYGHIRQMNRIAEQLTGWEEDEAEGKFLIEVYNIINEDTLLQVTTPLDRILKADKTVGVSNHNLLISKNGKQIPIADSGSPIKDDENKTIGIVLVFRDQTEERAKQKMLADSEKRYRNFFEKNIAGTYLSTAEGKLIDCNASFAKMLGYNSIDEVLSINTTKLHSKDTIHENFLDKLRDKKTLNNSEIILTKKDGTEITCIENVVGIFDDNDNLLQFQGYILDITERKRAEEKMKLSEERYKTLFEASPVGVVLEDEQGTILETNDSFCRMTGYSREELIGNNIKMFVSMDKYTDVEKNINDLLDGKLLEHTVESLKKDGNAIYLQLSETRITLPDKRAGILSISIDITERREALKRIRNLSRAVEQSPVIIIITDTNARIEYVNPKFTEVTGFTSEEALGKNPRILKSGYTTSEDYSIMWDTLLNNKEWSGEFYNRKKNGELFWVSSNISSIVDENGKVIKYLAIYEDITERKKTTEELIAAKEKAEEMNRIKSYFYANMSHELRTPFVGILGYSELLTDSLLDEEQRFMADQILISSKRLTDTLNKVLDITKIEFDKIEQVSVSTDIFEMIKNLQSLFMISAELNNTEIKTVFECEPFILKTDERLLREVLTNLINNAVKFTFSGVITISVGKISKEHKDHLFIKVADTGVGIPKDKQQIIWQEFRQASEGLNRSFEGTGLGLTIAKKYTELLGGQIFVESEFGEGSVFTIELPVIYDGLGIEKQHVKEFILNKKKSTDKSEIRHKILYVEDDPVTIRLVNYVLKNYYDIKTISDSKEALKLINENKYDVLMIDINLGSGMDGVELTQLIRQNPLYKKTPIVAVTAFATNNDKEEFLSKGFSHYLSKPFTITELKEIITLSLKTTV